MFGNARDSGTTTETSTGCHMPGSELLLTCSLIDMFQMSVAEKITNSAWFSPDNLSEDGVNIWPLTVNSVPGFILSLFTISLTCESL